ncbi:hypothetical protein B0H63DRAFT_247950 [Podospora didyma]|uniref:Uncharacterized protein n=1 Tax=Podospora didyma TaxID=330526 RepID=A0AAE0KKJ7_9PEZI|nr:hypothetical protein B0H63DRAFT_247950 [Podospora didyma]
MMPSMLHSNMSQPHHASFTADTEMNFDEVSRDLVAYNDLGKRLGAAAAAGSRRHSRSSACNNQQRVGHATRITKPGSANNSPRSAIVQSRRRTFIGDGLQGRLPPQHAIDMSYLPTPASEQSSEPVYERESKPPRPVSWHPSSQYIVQPQNYPQQPTAMLYPYSTYGEVEAMPSYQTLPPTPAVYSGYTSPSSTFSPLSLPYSGFGSQQVYSPPTQSLPAQQAPIFRPAYRTNLEQEGVVSEIPYRPGPRLAGGSLDWESFAAQGGFDRGTAPPTPEDFDQAQKIETKLATEESIPYQPLEDDESDGEILYGMGLYDAPNKSVQDPSLDLHRSTILSLLGGVASYPEPTGKGLKLEDAWEPPASDDEEDMDGEDDGEDDGDGDDQSE